MAVNILAGNYATYSASSPVTDIILSNIPVVNVDDFFVFGPILFWAIIIAYCLVNPKKIPFWLKSVALFVVVRSVFISLTHVGPFPDRVITDTFTLIANYNFFIFNSGADLFFSGHTGLPFLCALIFWDNFRLRIFCLLSAVFFGVIVLLGHMHYSIDVLSAFFITYTIYHIALKIFPADRARFYE
jgi:membrane-associated phospholipid phosphatase